jgi:hypothetical protein
MGRRCRLAGKTGSTLAWVIVLLLPLSGTGNAPPTPTRKWVGPEVPTPDGGTVQATIYYGPWQCRQEWLTACQAKCTSEGYNLMGCIWLADIKTDMKTRFLGSPVSAGGRLAIKHCCCDYPVATDQEQRRNTWKNGADAFRRKWAKEFGRWPTGPTGENWPGHHIRDIRHGGEPLAERNVLPAPPDTHLVFNSAYLACYSGKGSWNTPGPYWPYTD